MPVIFSNSDSGRKCVCYISVSSRITICEVCCTAFFHHYLLIGLKSTELYVTAEDAVGECARTTEAEVRLYCGS